jgi:hypothetical protein
MKLNHNKSYYAIFFDIDDFIQSYRLKFDNGQATGDIEIPEFVGRIGIAQI